MAIVQPAKNRSAWLSHCHQGAAKIIEVDAGVRIVEAVLDSFRATDSRPTRPLQPPSLGQAKKQEEFLGRAS